MSDNDIFQIAFAMGYTSIVEQYSKDIFRFLIWGIGSLCIFTAGLWIFGAWYPNFSYSLQYQTNAPLNCNIAVVPIVGEIVPYGTPLPPTADIDEEILMSLPPITVVDDVLAQVRFIESDPYIQGVMIRVDSPGGAPVASETITNALRALPFPTAALVRDVAASGGYMIATAADSIFASPMSVVGSIGVTMSYVDETEKNKKEGLQFVSLSSGPYKDMFAPGKPLTQTERALVERDLQESHADFVQLVAANRRLSEEVVAKIADGSVMLGRRAKENGLIDGIGGQSELKKWFAEKLGISESEVIFCE